MSLSQIQKDFVEAIFGGETTTVAQHIIGDDVLTAEQRFGIYRGSVHGILIQALGLTFPVCKALVGEKFFDKMSGLFIDKYPPKTSFFAEYGIHFSSFLESFEPVKQISYISDVARLEWARHEVSHKKPKPSFDFEQLAELSEDEQSNVVFELTDTMRLIESKYRIDDIWFAHQEDSDVKLDEIDLNHTVKLIIWKDKTILKITLMNNNEEDNQFWDFLYAISKGNTLEQLVVEYGEKLPTLLNLTIQSNWVRSYKN